MGKAEKVSAEALAGLVPQDFVYGGRRLGRDFMVDAIIPIMDGKLGPERVFKAERRERLIGGIYRGASFNATHAQSLNKATYTGSRWSEKADIVRWEAESEVAKENQRIERLEAQEKAEGTIEKEMAGLRAIWQGMAQRGDHAGCMALERAIALALRRRPSKA